MTNTTEIRKASERGGADHGWLKSRHSFSFASYYDPEHMGFSDLLVINDDHVAAGGGFDTHAHRDMEIFSYVLQGSLEHKDTLGTGSVIRKGDVQLMSAGTGVAHSEYNASSTAPVHFLQIWVVPNAKGIEPRYQQQHFSTEEKRGSLRLVLSPDGQDGSLSINQDVRVYAGLFDGAERATLSLPIARHAYVHVASGSLSVNGQRLKAGDGLKIRHAQTLEFNHGEEAEVLVFDLRPQEQPKM
ncbi:quercetin 2,3-dioxygenase [Pseudomonas sp. R-28-1W-6]|uniref:pirin family protein n=1 Tax=Pseudomonas sp. R-28-1W-6 TaxID=2650101 RepID=UPI0013651D49|nr:pirin family protein [Pseudomonas sp. R-28-1W-6]MWV11711.1 quercetin 2,3-dioxygenase [Pseudomonas sp. R-28-1W-6]